MKTVCVLQCHFGYRQTQPRRFQHKEDLLPFSAKATSTNNNFKPAYWRPSIHMSVLATAVQLCCVMETNYELDLRFFREKKQKSSRKRAVEPKALKVLKP